MNDERLKLKKTQLKPIDKRTKIRTRTSTSTLNHRQQRRQQLLSTILLQLHQQPLRRQLLQQRRQQPHQQLLPMVTSSQPTVMRQTHKIHMLFKVETVEMQMPMALQPLRKSL